MAPRDEVRKALMSLAKGPQANAIATLGLTPGLAKEIELNALLLTSSAAPAIEIYTGVLYEALGWNSLAPSAKKRGQTNLRIFSALFGALRPLDLIPPYRLSMNVSLPEIGALGNYWKKHLAVLDNQEQQLVIDLRSQAYAKAWTPTFAQTASVRVFVEKSGKRTVISHMAKKTRGEIARALLSLARAPIDIEDAAEALSKNFKIELIKPAKAKNLFSMDVILKS